MLAEKDLLPNVDVIIKRDPQSGRRKTKNYCEFNSSPLRTPAAYARDVRAAILVYGPQYDKTNK